MISICSLIYRSPSYADAVWQSAHEFTPHLQDGRARFFFVANDATQEVLDHLRFRRYPHEIQVNERLTEAELRKMGFDPPEYIRRVYLGWNRAILESEEELVLVNSDNLFSPGWLEGLLNNLNEKQVVCSILIEGNHRRHAPFKGAIRGEFGRHPREFKKRAFLDLCERNRKAGTSIGGAYMPCAIRKSVAIRAGLYPEGNPHRASGDERFFAKLKSIGVRHVTALDSLVYHFKEGEMDE